MFLWLFYNNFISCMTEQPVLCRTIIYTFTHLVINYFLFSFIMSKLQCLVLCETHMGYTSFQTDQFTHSSWVTFLPCQLFPYLHGPSLFECIYVQCLPYSLRMHSLSINIESRFIKTSWHTCLLRFASFSRFFFWMSVWINKYLK